MQFHSILTLAVTLVASLVLHAFAFAHDYGIRDLRIDHPHARPTVANQPSGVAYLSIENKGRHADRLVEARSPVAKRVEFHTMAMQGNVMTMREAKGIELQPSSKTVMQPGHGYHLMLIGLERPLKAGDKFPLTLIFEKAGKLEVSVWVEDKDAGSQHRH